MVVGELTEASAVISTQVPRWLEIETKYVDVTSPDNIMFQGGLEGGAIVNACVSVHPYHGSRIRVARRSGHGSRTNWLPDLLRSRKLFQRKHVARVPERLVAGEA